MVAIKDFGMPSCCAECNLTACKGYDEPWNYCCSVTLTDINLNDATKPSDCPLVEIEERKVGKCSGCSHAECSHTQVMQIPPVDVIERDKINKAIEEMDNIDLNEYADNTYQLVNECINIFKRNIGE